MGGEVPAVTLGELFLLIYNILHMERIGFANRWVRGCVDGMLR